MKKENGITLISLVITIILILILASVSIYTGVDIYEQMRVKNFVAKMKAVQVAVDKVCDKYTVQEINSKIGIIANSTDVPTEDINVLSQVISEGNADKLKSWYSDAGDGVNSNYRYLTKERINSDLGLKDFDTSIFFNPRTRNIIAVKGVKHENKIYYRQYDLPEGQELKEPNTDTDFNLNVSVKTFDNKAVIYVSHEKDGNNINITELKYFKQKEDGTFGDGIISRNLNEITITESGTYKVEAKVNGSSTETITEETRNVKDGVITKTADNIKVAIVNKPMLVDGMVPVKYDASGNQIQTTANDKDWYNYGNKEWANVILKDGSVYVWIPRYAYSITYTNPSEISEGGTIDVEFMKETSSSITTSGDTLKDSYKVMPAFQDGTRNGFTNGEWDSELTGIWVAKCEAINNYGKPKNALTSSDEKAWSITKPVKLFFDLCRKMEGEFKGTYFGNNVQPASGSLLYGNYKTDTNNIDTHLIKNSEWGAAVYLTDSIYGAGSKKVTTVESLFIKDESAEENGKQIHSSTNNYTGIYGLNGGAFDLVAAGVNFAEYYNFENKSTKYATIYNSNIIGGDNAIYGDAMQETSGWNGNKEDDSIDKIIGRGGTHLLNNSGIFAYQQKNYEGSEDSLTSFRPVIIVDLNPKVTPDYPKLRSMYGSILTGYDVGNDLDDSKKVDSWKLFYVDEENEEAFFISSNTLSAPQPTENGISMIEKYSNMDSIRSSEYAKNYNSLWLGINESQIKYINAKAVAYLCDKNNWSIYANDYAKYAVGGPTIEMFIASFYNKQIKDFASISTDENGSNLKSVTLAGYPRILENGTIPLNSLYSNEKHYWLASPSNTDKGDVKYFKYSDQRDSGSGYDSTYIGLRPIVCFSASSLSIKSDNTLEIIKE